MNSTRATVPITVMCLLMSNWAWIEWWAETDPVNHMPHTEAAARVPTRTRLIKPPHNDGRPASYTWPQDGYNLRGPRRAHFHPHRAGVCDGAPGLRGGVRVARPTGGVTMIQRAYVVGLVLAAVAAGACTPSRDSAAEGATTTGPARVDAARLAGADTEPGQWMSHGRTYGEQRFSPLDQINTSTVGRLALSWFADLDSRRGQEATPLVVDGVLYVSTAWSRVKAYDAATGKPLWTYDPQV